MFLLAIPARVRDADPGTEEGAPLTFQQLPNTHLGRTPCVDCGALVLATPEQARNARCSGCWRAKVDPVSVHGR